MPEMPEVETIARKLRKAIVGKRIVKVHLSGLPLRKPIDSTFSLRLQDRIIRKIHRRGKYLIAEMEPQSFWLIHLGMSGRIYYDHPAGEVEAHTHATVYFSDDSELRYRDHRRFGLLAAYDVSRMNQIPELRFLGVDPLSARFHVEWLGRELSKCKQEIKSFLLDQRKVAGLGNIYACEALHAAPIHPSQRCNTFTRAQTKRLRDAVRSVLRAAIRHRGTTFSDFKDSDGRLGTHQEFLQVFQREGKKCSRCPGKIKRVRQGNRSTFFCPRCQVKMKS